MQKGLISIIVPVYNANKFIDRCLFSLINQTYSNIEILCVDDCSADNSCEIIENYLKKDNRIKLFKNEKNSGSATTRNVGLKNAAGEFIMFCDNDDEYKLNMCEAMIGAIVGNDVDFALCRVDVINQKLNKGASKCINSFHNGKLSLDVTYCDLIGVHVWNKIFRKSLIDKYKIKFPDNLTSEDVAFVDNYLLVSNNYYGIEEKLYNYHLHSQSYMYNHGFYKMGEKLFDSIKILEYIYNFAKQNALLDKKLKYLKMFFYKELCYPLAFSLNKKNKAKIKKLYNDFIKNSDLNWNEFNFNVFFPSRVKRIIRFMKLFFKGAWT